MNNTNGCGALRFGGGWFAVEICDDPLKKKSTDNKRVHFLSNSFEDKEIALQYVEAYATINKIKFIGKEIITMEKPALMLFQEGQLWYPVKILPEEVLQLGPGVPSYPLAYAVANAIAKKEGLNFEGIAFKSNDS